MLSETQALPSSSLQVTKPSSNLTILRHKPTPAVLLPRAEWSNPQIPEARIKSSSRSWLRAGRAKTTTALSISSQGKASRDTQPLSAHQDPLSATNNCRRPIPTASILVTSSGTHARKSPSSQNCSLTGLTRTMPPASMSSHASSLISSTKSTLTTIWVCASISLIRRSTKWTPNSKDQCYLEPVHKTLL